MNQPYSQIAKALFNTPWLIRQRELELITAIVEVNVTAKLNARDGGNRSPVIAEGIELRNRATMQQASERVAMQTSDGLATINITGAITRYQSKFGAVSGSGSSTEAIRNEFQAAMSDASIKGILLNIDSPGGEASGIAEFAEMVYAARNKKPVVAYGGGLACSAAYWIASAASGMVVDPTSPLGSIGVVASWTDTKDFFARQGIYQRSMVSSQSPLKRADLNSETGAALLQAELNSLADVFIGAVARNRGIDAKKVISDFGQGGVKMGAAAVQAGMADRVGYFDDAMEMVKRLSRVSLMPTSRANQAGAAAQTDQRGIRLLPAAAEHAQAASDALESAPEEPTIDRKTEFLKSSGLGRMTLTRRTGRN